MRAEPDLQALRALTLAARENSISAAAGLLGVSQQAVSLRIRTLERELGARLLVRSTRGSRLTPAGEQVVGWAQPLLAAADAFADAARALRDDRTTTLRIAASLTIAEHLMPRWIGTWRAQVGEHGPEVQVTAANSSTVAMSVRDGTADLGFVESPRTPAGLGSATVAHDTLDVVVQPEHRWARARSITAHELATTGLVLREKGSGTRQAFDAAMADAGYPDHAEPVMVQKSTLGMRSAIMGGTAPGVLSSLAVADDVRTGRLARVRVEGLTMSRPLTALWAGAAPPRHAREFLDACAE